jgi:16S rRNA processing protein RimM
MATSQRYDRPDYYFLGKIVKTSGFKGGLVFFFDVDDIGYYRDLEAVFIEVAGELIPFAIHSIQLKTSNTAYVQLEEVNTDEEATALTGSALYLPTSFLPPLTGNKFYYHEVIGFTVEDRAKGPVGIVESVIDQGPQAILSIRFEGKEILLPISDTVLKTVDRKGKKLLVEAPDGLIDLYLNP